MIDSVRQNRCSPKCGWWARAGLIETGAICRVSYNNATVNDAIQGVLVYRAVRQPAASLPAAAL